MKKILLLNLMMLLLSWSIYAQTAIKPVLGDGTGTNPYQIASLENLYWISANPNEWGKCFIQTEDIDASPTSSWFDGTGWVPIGTGAAPFLGYYNGQGHTINNLYIKRFMTYQGLFGLAGNWLYSKWARIENLGVTNVNFSNGVSTGGLLGSNECGYISNCYSTGVVNGTFYYFGGLVGASSSKSRITFCYSSVNVTGSGVCNVGGLVGYLGEGGEISNCYSRGSATSREEREDPEHPSRTGGLVGQVKENGVIKNCYSTGKVTGIGAVGGLVGYADGTPFVSNSFWDIITSGQPLSPGGGTGKTTAEMQIQSTFTGWDFATIWSINAANNDGYPDFIVNSDCNDATITLISGNENQTVCANTEITPIVYQVGGGAASAFISPALPTGFSGYYNATNGTYTISGKSSSAVDYAFSVITFGTLSPCAESAASGIISVHSVTPAVTILSSDDDNTFCEGTSLTFTATPNNTGGGTVLYTWKLNGSAVGTDQNIYVTDTLKEGDRVKCEISLTGGECLTSTGAVSNEIQMTVIPNITPSVIITSSDADNIICENTEVTFTATPLNTDDGTVDYQWYYFDNRTSNLYHSEYWNKNTWTWNEFGNGDEVYCVITVTGGTCLTSHTATSDIITIEVYTPETRPSVTIESESSGAICPGADVTFTAIPEKTGGGTVTYQWYFFCKRTNELYVYPSWNTNPMYMIELEEGDSVYCEITVTGATCNPEPAKALSNKITISEIAPPHAGEVYGENVIQVRESTTLSAEIPGGEWFCYDNYEENGVATVDAVGVVTGIQAGTTIIYYMIPVEKVPPCNFIYAITEFPITVISDIPPVFTTCPGNQTANTEDGLCSAVVSYEAAATGSPEPIITYHFSGATAGSGTGTGAGSVFNKGETIVTITASNGILPDATCSFKVTVTDDEAPAITCAAEITQTADPGMCSAVVTVVPPAVTDNCDNSVLPISNTELIKNGSFNAGVSNWQDCGNKAEVNTEEYYIVPLPDPSSNYVAEVDDEVSLCQTISGLTAGDKYVLTFKATRRQNTGTPNPVSANVVIDGGALSQVVTRTNTVFDLTPETFVFTATQETHKLTFTPYTDNTYVLGFIVDDVSVRSITYPVGTTTLVWTATDVYGNTNTCEQKITVTDNEIPVITKEDDITQTADEGLCSAAIVVTAPVATDNCGILGSVAGTRSDAPLTLADPFPVGTTTITWTVSDIHDNPATPVTQLVTVTDDEAPAITCAEEINQTADPGMCTAVVTVVPPAVTDNCDNSVLPISNTELIKNGNFNEGVFNWQDCGNTAEVNTEEYYIVPLPDPSSNYVAEIDVEASLCQTISGLTVGDKYVLTFKATRRQNTGTPNPVSANVIIDGGVLSKVVTRTNTIFDLTTESFEFTATQETHKLTFTPSADNKYTLGLIVDDISVRSITYPVGTTTLVWTAADVYGNIATCEQDIIVSDNESPIFSEFVPQILLDNDPGTCSSVMNETGLSASDNCDNDVAISYYIFLGLDEEEDPILEAITFPYTFPVGTNSITAIARDDAGNTHELSFDIIITDAEEPTITCPADIADAVTSNDGGNDCYTTVDLGSPATGDNCGVLEVFAKVDNVVIDPKMYLFPVGQTTVTWVVTDVNNNTNSSTQLVTVFDNEDPTASDPAAINVECFSQIPDPDITVVTDEADNCGTPVVEYVGTVLKFAIVCDGAETTYERTYSVTDDAGNSIEVHQMIHVKDMTNPTASDPTAINVECFSKIPEPDPEVVTDEDDNCLGDPVVEWVSDDVTSFDCDGAIKTVTRTYAVTDCAGNSIDVHQIFNIEDVTAPTVITKDAEITVKLDGTASISVSDIDAGTFDNCEGELEFELDKTSVNCEEAPGVTVTLTATDCAGNSASNTAYVAVLKRETLLENKGVYSGQYSDKVTLQAVLTDKETGTPLVGKAVKFTIGKQDATDEATDASGMAEVTITLNQDPNDSYTIVAEYAGECTFLASSDEDVFDITQEDACWTYTGPLFSTVNADGTVTLLLTATVYESDLYNHGELSKAKVSLILENESNVRIAAVDCSITPDPNDHSIGYISYEHTFTGIDDLAQDFYIFLELSGYYTDESCSEQGSLHLYKPEGEFITGGGFINVSNSYGTYAADAGTKTNFGYHIKWNKTYKNLQGKMNIIYRRTEGGVLHRYQIKTNATSSLGMNPDGDCTFAEFTGKCSLTDITDPLNPLLIGGGLELRVITNDCGEPGENDAIGITLWGDKGKTLLYSSKWDGYQTIEQLLGGGNLVVHTNAKSASIATAVEPEFELADLKVYPNPFSEKLCFELVSPKPTDVRIDLYDMTGRLVKTIFEQPVEGGIGYKTEFCPDATVSAVYFYRVCLGNGVYHGKVIFKKE